MRVCCDSDDGNGKDIKIFIPMISGNLVKKINGHAYTFPSASLAKINIMKVMINIKCGLYENSIGALHLR